MHHQYIDKDNPVLEIPLKEGCNKDSMKGEDGCLELLDALYEKMENRPYKYGTKLVLTLHQDWSSGNWHLKGFEIGNYEEELYLEEIKNAKEGKLPEEYKGTPEDFISSRREMIRGLRW